MWKRKKSTFEGNLLAITAIESTERRLYTCLVLFNSTQVLLNNFHSAFTLYLSQFEKCKAENMYSCLRYFELIQYLSLLA